jgi:hypothetical protein
MKDDEINKLDWTHRELSKNCSQVYLELQWPSWHETNARIVMWHSQWPIWALIWKSKSKCDSSNNKNHCNFLNVNVRSFENEHQFQRKSMLIGMLELLNHFINEFLKLATYYPHPWYPHWCNPKCKWMMFHSN